MATATAERAEVYEHWRHPDGRAALLYYRVAGGVSVVSVYVEGTAASHRHDTSDLARVRWRLERMALRDRGYVRVPAPA